MDRPTKTARLRNGLISVTVAAFIAHNVAFTAAWIHARQHRGERVALDLFDGRYWEVLGPAVLGVVVAGWVVHASVRLHSKKIGSAQRDRA